MIHMLGFSRDEIEMVECVWELIGYECDPYEALETYIEIVGE